MTTAATTCRPMTHEQSCAAHRLLTEAATGCGSFVVPSDLHAGRDRWFPGSAPVRKVIRRLREAGYAMSRMRCGTYLVGMQSDEAAYQRLCEIGAASGCPVPPTPKGVDHSRWLAMCNCD